MTDDPTRADLNVWFRPSPEPGDLRVFMVTRPDEATSCGRWELVFEPDAADVVVHVPSDRAEVDVWVAEVSRIDDAGAS